MGFTFTVNIATFVSQLSFYVCCTQVVYTDLMYQIKSTHRFSHQYSLEKTNKERKYLGIHIIIIFKTEIFIEKSSQCKIEKPIIRFQGNLVKNRFFKYFRTSIIHDAFIRRYMGMGIPTSLYLFVTAIEFFFFKYLPSHGTLPKAKENSSRSIYFLCTL